MRRQEVLTIIRKSKKKRIIRRQERKLTLTLPTEKKSPSCRIDVACLTNENVCN
jgi:hypothetical protein